MQLSYDYAQPVAVLGLVTEDFTKYTDTVIPQIEVKVGKLLTADKAAGKVRNAAKLPAAAADVTKPGAMGITFLDPTRESGSDIPAMRPTGVIRRGRVWVLAESAVARWTHPFVRHAAGAGGTELGSFRGDADTASAAELTHAIFLTDAGAGDLVLVEIDLF
jgi:hypothetical protein